MPAPTDNARLVAAEADGRKADVTPTKRLSCLTGCGYSEEVPLSSESLVCPNCLESGDRPTARIHKANARFYRETEKHLSADLKRLAKAKDGHGLRAALEGHMHFLLRHPDAIPSED